MQTSQQFTAGIINTAHSGGYAAPEGILSMISALPKPVLIRLEQTLAQWRQWQCQPLLSRAPQAAGILGDGISNFSILVGQERQFVVRIDGINPAANGLNRQAEWHALVAAHQAGIAPGPRYFNPDLGSLVCDYLAHDDAQPQSIDDLASLLRCIHSLPPRHHRLDLQERTRRYEKILEHRRQRLPPGLTACRPQILGILRELATQSQPQVLCHNDLLRANRFYSNQQLWAIDWEYCAMGSPWYDLAVVAGGDALDELQTRALLLAYLGREADAQEWQLLRSYCCIYRYIELLWYLSQQKSPPQRDFITRRIAALTSQLQTSAAPV